MGMFKLADAVTGLGFSDDESVVAVLIRRRTGGYPDAAATAAKPGIGPSHLFQQVSLPIRAKAGSYGDIEVGKGQESVRLACAITGSRDWEHLNETALNWQVGASVNDFSVFRRMHGGEPPEPEVLGVAAFGEATMRAMRETTPAIGSKVEQVRLMRDVFVDAWSRKVSDATYGRLSTVLEMRAVGTYEFADGRKVELPHFARILSMVEEPFVADPLGQQLTSRAGPLGMEPLYDEGMRDTKRLVDVLGGLWDADLLRRGLDGLGRYLLPSPSVGQYANWREVASLSRHSLEAAVAGRLRDAEENDDERAIGQAVRLLADLDATREQLWARIEGAKALWEERGFGPAEIDGEDGSSSPSP